MVNCKLLLVNCQNACYNQYNLRKRVSDIANKSRRGTELALNG